MGGCMTTSVTASVGSEDNCWEAPLKCWGLNSIPQIGVADSPDQLFSFSEAEFYVAQAGPEVLLLLPLLCWDYRPDSTLSAEGS